MERYSNGRELEFDNTDSFINSLSPAQLIMLRAVSCRVDFLDKLDKKLQAIPQEVVDNPDTIKELDSYKFRNP